MSNITITLCEGQDDIAFLTRILYIQGFEKYNGKLENFIKPFDKLFISKIKQADKFGFSPANYLIPSVVLTKDNNYVLLHNLGGDSDGRSSEIKNILDMYNGIKSDKDDFSNYDFDYKFLLFFDADEDIKTREKSVCDLLEREIKHNKMTENYGLYVFHKDGRGTLEDILLELMVHGNESEFDSAKKFVEENKFDDEERCKEFVCSNTKEEHKGSSKFYEKKSIISIAGQLQFSAKSNSVIVEKSDYIQKSDLLTNGICKEIADMFIED